MTASEKQAWATIGFMLIRGGAPAGGVTDFANAIADDGSNVNGVLDSILNADPEGLNAQKKLSGFFAGTYPPAPNGGGSDAAAIAALQTEVATLQADLAAIKAAIK